MAPRKGAGRKPAKNEVAAALMAAIKFGSVLKTPTTTSIEQAHFAWLQAGTCVMFDGIVASGHPIPADVQGYPNAKLLHDALDNTDKSFTWTVHDNGTFEINSGHYNALVPALDYGKVIPTVPDQQQVRVQSSEALIASFEAALKVAVEAGDVVMYSSLRCTGSSIMATNGTVIIEVRDSNNLPQIILPRQFAAAVVKAGKKAVGMGIGVDWKTFTIWFEDGAWLRTALYAPDSWPSDALDLFYNAMNAQGGDLHPLDAKLWAAVAAVMPFAGDDDRVMLRPGQVSTFGQSYNGAKLDVKENPFTFDTNGKRFLALAGLASNAAILPNLVMRFFGDNSRGLVAGMPLVSTVDTLPGNWGGEQASPQPAPSVGGWGDGAVQSNMSPPADPAPKSEAVSGDLNPDGKWKGGPEIGAGASAEFQSQYLDQPIEDFYDDPADVPPPVEGGVTLGGDWNTVIQQGFSAGGWLNQLDAENAGELKTEEKPQGGW